MLRAAASMLLKPSLLLAAAQNCSEWPGISLSAMEKYGCMPGAAARSRQSRWSRGLSCLSELHAQSLHGGGIMLVHGLVGLARLVGLCLGLDL